MIIAKIYKIFKDDLEIQDKKITKNNVDIIHDDFKNLETGKQLCIQLDALNIIDLGCIVSIDSIIYRKIPCYNIKTELYTRNLIKF